MELPFWEHVIKGSENKDTIAQPTLYFTNPLIAFCIVFLESLLNQIRRNFFLAECTFIVSA